MLILESSTAFCNSLPTMRYAAVLAGYKRTSGGSSNREIVVPLTIIVAVFFEFKASKSLGIIGV